VADAWRGGVMGLLLDNDVLLQRVVVHVVVLISGVSSPLVARRTSTPAGLAPVSVEVPAGGQGRHHGGRCGPPPAIAAHTHGAARISSAPGAPPQDR
jgi:hypothetical protein